MRTAPGPAAIVTSTSAVCTAAVAAAFAELSASANSLDAFIACLVAGE